MEKKKISKGAKYIRVEDAKLEGSKLKILQEYCGVCQSYQQVRHTVSLHPKEVYQNIRKLIEFYGIEKQDYEIEITKLEKELSY